MNFQIQLTHKIILRRLFFGWLLLSSLLAAALLYYKIGVVDQRLHDFALSEARSFVVKSDWADPGQEEILKREADKFLKGSFMVLELYDQSQNEVLRVSQLDAATENKLKLKTDTNPSPLTNERDPKTFLVDGELYVQVVVPLLTRSGEAVGYFEGVFQVDARTMRDIKFEIAVVLLLVFVVTFFTAGILYPFILFLNRGVLKLSSDLLESNIELLKVLGSAIAKRDSDTGSHNYRVTIYAIRMAEAMKLHNEQIRDLIMGAFLHDVGKIGISDSILLKNGKLSEEEFAIMRKHVLLGADIISNSLWLMGARDVVEFHHEKFDGSGYVRGMKGEEIPLNARIFAIIDVFDALVSVRPYKKAFSFEEAMNIMQDGSGNHFDPELLSVFSSIVRSIYLEINFVMEYTLKELLNRLVKKYF